MDTSLKNELLSGSYGLSVGVFQDGSSNRVVRMLNGLRNSSTSPAFHMSILEFCYISGLATDVDEAEEMNVSSRVDFIAPVLFAYERFRDSRIPEGARVDKIIRNTVNATDIVALCVCSMTRDASSNNIMDYFIKKFTNEIDYDEAARVIIDEYIMSTSYNPSKLSIAKFLKLFDFKSGKLTKAILERININKTNPRINEQMTDLLSNNGGMVDAAVLGRTLRERIRTVTDY